MTPAAVGFVGLGTMGLPMATRLLDAGVPLAVWNRTPDKGAPLAARGATVADSIDDLCARCDLLLVMLLDQQAVDAAFGRGTEDFARRVAGRTLVLLGTTSPEWSRAFGEAVRACGGRHVEAPVSGSRGPAESGALIGMVAGEDDDIARVSPLLEPLCRQVVACGAVPRALQLKLAVNHYLIVLVAALAEAVRAAEAVGVDMALFRTVLDAGPMASDVSRAKLAKLAAGDLAPQAAIRDVTQIAALVADQSRGARVDAPLIDASAALFREALARGLGELDMAAVLHADGGMASRVAAHEVPIAFDAATVAPRAVRSIYPEPFAGRMAGREKRVLGDPFGLRHFGVNLVTLAPGAASALRHAHARQDEFVHVLQGHPVLHTDAGATPLAPGWCAGFAAGSGDAHRLVNESDAPVTYLEIGDRTPGDRVQYPDDDLVAIGTASGWRFTRRDGTPY